ncbi:MAG: (d)CMP kinase [Streptococcaceae bacterium]|jgi:cytidylate kinase|nr:(d)CMP kinase [Streptococcaceae bacterium]
MKKISIAIDGPASSGKSTVAKILAKDYGYIYIDTGSMYRALTYMALKEKIDVNNEEDLDDLLKRISIALKQGKSGQQIFVDKKEVTEEIRIPDVTNNVSNVSAHKKVRTTMVKLQKNYGKHGGVVMDGRDIGTVVLPNAQVKIFLVASVFERAQRRFKENQMKGILTDFNTLKDEIQRRDFLDSTRKISPLVQAEDAILLDTTGLNIAEVVDEIKKLVSEKSKIS